MGIYENIKDVCSTKNVSINRLEQELGFARSSIGKFNKNIPSVEKLQKIADYLNVSIDCLNTGETPQEKSKGTWIKVYGHVAAGISIEAIEDIIDEEEITAEMASKGDHFGLRVKGNSMESLIHENDNVIVLKQCHAESGDIVIAMVNGNDAICKKLTIKESGIMLSSLNPNYEPLFYTNEEIENIPVSILGKVVELRRKL